MNYLNQASLEWTVGRKILIFSIQKRASLVGGEEFCRFGHPFARFFERLEDVGDAAEERRRRQPVHQVLPTTGPVQLGPALVRQESSGLTTRAFDSLTVGLARGKAYS